MSNKETAWNNAKGKVKQTNGDGFITQRCDRKGKLMQWSEHGNENRPLGWNIHHVDGNNRNNVDSNLEALNYKTHIDLNNLNK